LFPNDQVLLIKNVDQSKYESFIDLFAAFITETDEEYIGYLQMKCIEIDTNSEIKNKSIQVMIDRINYTKFKYTNWTLSYEQIERHDVGNEHKEIFYILIRKNQIETYDEEEKEKSDEFEESINDEMDQTEIHRMNNINKKEIFHNKSNILQVMDDLDLNETHNAMNKLVEDEEVDSNELMIINKLNEDGTNQHRPFTLRFKYIPKSKMDDNVSMPIFGKKQRVKKDQNKAQSDEIKAMRIGRFKVKMSDK